MTGDPTFRRENSPASGPVRPFHIPAVQEERLENGLDIRAIRRAAVPLVSMVLVLDAGETAVTAGAEGLAVLTGDSLLGGTPDLPPGELAEALDGLGSGLVVSTGWDSTTIAFTCLAERAGEMLGLAGRVVAEPAFPPDEVERVRDQQIAGIRQGRMLPARLASDTLNAAMFAPVEPYHRPMSGTEPSVGAMSRADTEAFHAARYSSGSAGLAVVGDLSADQVVALASDRLGSWRKVPSPRAEPARAPDGGRRIVVVNRPGSVQSEIRVGHPAPPRGHPDEMALRIANTILGGAFTSRLNMSLREKHGFTYGARSSFSFHRWRGSFSAATAVQTEVTVPALEEMMSVLDAFAREGPTSDELPRARDYLAGVVPLQMETTYQLASRLAGTMIFGLPADYYQTYRERIRAVDVEGAVRAVRSHLDPRRMSVVVVGDAERLVGGIEAMGLGQVDVVDP